MTKAIKNEIVILIHGMGRTKLSMIMLRNYLKKQGYSTVSFSYSSTLHSISVLSAKFADFISEISTKHPEKQIHIVSHSLGGILTRQAIVNLENNFPNKKNNIKLGRIVMLAPPNKGSKAANIFCKIWPVPKILKPISELRNSEDSPINNIPIPQNVDIGIIAGKFDAKVTLEESHMTKEKEHIIVNSAHTFIMNKRNVQIAVTNFLQHGTFKNVPA